MRTFFTAIILGMVLSACEREKGTVIDSILDTPFLGSVTLSASKLNLDDTLPSPFVNRLPSGQFLITDTLTVEVEDPQGPGNILLVNFRISAPGSTGVVASGRLNHLFDSGPASTRATYSGTFQYIISRTDVGDYRVEAYAVNRMNRESNRTELRLLIGRSNSSPVLRIPTERHYTPPGSDSTRVTLAVAAMDSDGYTDIAGVMMLGRNVQDSSVHYLADDGSVQSGDQLTGDGLYTTILWIHPLFALKQVQFELTAFDTKGALSAIVRRSLDNRPPQILSLNVPDSIQRPPSTTLIVFSLTTADSDGLTDIDSVYFRNFSSQTPTNFLLFDDGQLSQHGDQVRGDGVYSLIVQIDFRTTLGRKEFHFFVVDKSGATTTTTKFITIY